jgi:hypothetical protein
MKLHELHSAEGSRRIENVSVVVLQVVTVRLLAVVKRVNWLVKAVTHV